MGLPTALFYLACGMLPLLWLPTLPSGGASALLLGVALLCLRRRGGVSLRIGLLCLGLLWGSERGHQALRPLAYADRAVTLEGQVVSASLASAAPRQPVILRVTRLAGRAVAPFRLLLHWDSLRFPFAAGQRWQVDAMPRALHGTLNPAGFDLQRHYLSQDVVLSATPRGYRLLDPRRTLRQRIIDLAVRRLADHSAQPLLLALLFGERGGITAESRTLLRQSGTLHLMAISGLHIALAAALAHGLWRGVALLLPLHWQTPRQPLALAVLAAWGYAWLAGVPPPTLRAALMVTLYALWRWRGRQSTLRDVLTLTLSLGLLTEPLLLLSSGFWLSVSAVASLLFWSAWQPLSDRLRRPGCAPLRLLHLQLGLLLLLSPLQLALFHGISWTAPLANLAAVPLVSLGVMPLALAGLLLTLVGLPWAGEGAWGVALWLLEALLALLRRLPDGWLTPSSLALVYSALALALALLWSIRQGGRDLWLCLLCGLLAAGGALRGRSGSEGWRVEMMDVGHGQAIAISRRGQALLYDSGGRWPGGDAAQQIVLPYLRWQGLRLSGIIISHADSDHAGGRRTLTQAYPLAWLASPAPNDLPCRRGLHTYWQGLRIDFLWPPRAVARPRNNDSCVVRISGPGGALLLTGDIEADSERALLATGTDLRAAVMQVPHHGSSSSSSEELLQAVQPALALASAARYSPWRFPAPSVRQRYDQRGIAWRDTAHEGMIRVDFSAAGWRVSAQRQQIDPHWYHAWFGVDGHNG
ncbi:DNA internalization-related competence protein ComEC/Rec2 [Edwardsiella piscicida]|uniref:DNA internalization-related competence protein ComEC/Rec2 n=1 Tax=Edwardsiella piscicida TaxID=1263550 RepID=UPI00370D65EC